jgi:hypothetical protein
MMNSLMDGCDKIVIFDPEEVILRRINVTDQLLGIPVESSDFKIERAIVSYLDRRTTLEWQMRQVKRNEPLKRDIAKLLRSIRKLKELIKIAEDEVADMHEFCLDIELPCELSRYNQVERKYADLNPKNHFDMITLKVKSKLPDSKFTITNRRDCQSKTFTDEHA